MDLYEKNGNILYILNVLKKYSDEDHKLYATEIAEKIKEIYDVDIDSRTVRRNINLLKYKFEYDISTREENGKGYYISKNPDTDFEKGEIRAIIDTFSYSNYIVPSIAKDIIKKCKNLQNVYENKELENYKVFAKNSKTENMEVIKNIEDISDAIHNNRKIQFEYWKYSIDKKFEFKLNKSYKVSPYAMVYNEQEFYLIAIKDGEEKFQFFRLDRIKKIKALDEKKTIKKSEKEIDEFAKSTIEMFAGDIEEIEAICDNPLLNAVIDKFGKNITIIKNDENTFRLILDTDRNGFLFWALKNLREVEIIKPDSLRNEVKEIIKNAKKKYE